MPVESGRREFSAGTILGGRFRIVRAVGHGGMGVVYEAIDQKLERRVALKCAQPGHRHHLSPEASAAREVSHFNVCKVYDLHTFGTPMGEIDCISMEFIEGETLAGRIRRSGPPSPREALDIARQICAGMAQAHRQQVIHGDLKGANVMLSQSADKGLRAVITDFGLARIEGNAATRVLAGGTYDYMAPEQLLGQPATVASDLYALGVLFHVMLTGWPPARGNPLASPPEQAPAGPELPTVTLDYAIREADWHRKIADIPAPWKRVVARCLAARPEDRPLSADAVASALQPRRRLLNGTAAAMV
ncbi:MAG: serine/threonine protein kinase, partial [Acidobacteriota bacterium]|nr:serine/threonine protein kinase [Acidobacteriota bacterium]